MSAGSSFILNNYKTERILQKTDYSCTELVMQDGIPYVRKIINATGLPYSQLRNIVHTCLPHVFYTAEDNGKTYVIEEYISGRTLKECLEQGIVFSFEQQTNIALQLCSVLEFLHSRGILHRDIKPSNIIVMHDLQQVKLIDFGIGRSFDSNRTQETQDTRIMGTPGYAPPEQYGFTSTDQRSDIYALGRTLLELQNQYSDPAFIKAIQRCLEFDPDKRYQNTGELIKVLTGASKRKFLNPLILSVGLLIIFALSICYHIFNTKSDVPIVKSIPGQNTEQPAKTQQPPRHNNSEISPDAKQSASNAAPSSITKQPQPNNSHVKQQEAAQVITIPLARVKLKQVGYQWWFSKDTLQTVDAKDNIFRFKGWDNKGPLVTVENTSDYPAVNPILKLELYSFGMKADNYEYQTDDTHKEKVEFARHDKLGISRKVFISLDGTIPPHSKYTFSSLQNVNDFYMYYKGDHGTVLGDLKCRGMITQSVGYEFRLK